MCRAGATNNDLWDISPFVGLYGRLCLECSYYRGITAVKELRYNFIPLLGRPGAIKSCQI
jgi:hypothetical protein